MSELYELPNGWEWKTFEDKLVLIQNGLSDTQNDDGIGYPISRIETIQNETIDSNRIKYIDTNDNSIIEKYRYDYGDLLFSHINSFEKVGKVCLYTNQIENLLHGVNLLRMKFTDDINSKFVFYYLISNVSRRFYEPNIKKAINQASINQKNIKSIPLPLPPLSEQQRIVSKLDKLFEKIDKAIALHQKNMDEADVFMGSVLNDVFGELEEKYDTTTLNNLSNFQNGFAFKSNEFNTNGLGLKVIRIGNVLDINKNPVFIDERKEFEKYLLKENDIVISMTGTRGKKDYLFVRVVDTNDSYLNQRVGKISNKDNSHHRYLYYYLQSNYFRDKIFEFETGTVNQGNISSKDIMNSRIPNIPLLVQQKVVSYLDDISEKIEKVKSVQKEKMDSLKALKASILDKAFRGEL